MTDCLVWHRLPGVADHWRLSGIVRAHGYWLWIARAVIKLIDGRRHAVLPSDVPGPVSIIRCRTLHEAADCARRWAEYRGFRVESRFPEGRSHE